MHVRSCFVVFVRWQQRHRIRCELHVFRNTTHGQAALWACVGRAMKRSINLPPSSGLGISNNPETKHTNCQFDEKLPAITPHTHADGWRAPLSRSFVHTCCHLSRVNPARCGYLCVFACFVIFTWMFIKKCEGDLKFLKKCDGDLSIDCQEVWRTTKLSRNVKHWARAYLSVAPSKKSLKHLLSAVASWQTQGVRHTSWPKTYPDTRSEKHLSACSALCRHLLTNVRSPSCIRPTSWKTNYYYPDTPSEKAFQRLLSTARHFLKILRGPPYLLMASCPFCCCWIFDTLPPQNFTIVLIVTVTPRKHSSSCLALHWVRHTYFRTIRHTFLRTKYSVTVLHELRNSSHLLTNFRIRHILDKLFRKTSLQSKESVTLLHKLRNSRHFFEKLMNLSNVFTN